MVDPSASPAATSTQHNPNHVADRNTGETKLVAAARNTGVQQAPNPNRVAARNNGETKLVAARSTMKPVKGRTVTGQMSTSISRAKCDPMCLCVEHSKLPKSGSTDYVLGAVAAALLGLILVVIVCRKKQSLASSEQQIRATKGSCDW